MDSSNSRYGLIAGNGRFPILALESAQSLGHEVVVIAVRGEATEEIEKLGARVHWITIGQLGKLIDTLKKEGIRKVMMAGQVKHASLFSSITPDWRLIKMLASLKERNTSALIGGFQRVMRDEGIDLVDSTALLKPLLAVEGVLTTRKPSKEEEADILYGRRLAHVLASADVGQSVAISEGACVAAEAMEGTDAMLRRAGGLTDGKRLRLIKVSRGREHLLFDVPVVGPTTIETMMETRTTAMAIDAGRTLLLDKAKMLERANAASIAIAAFPPHEDSK
ncbi:MAG TPA: UDP-2,3-diacylglucosamine diphosphatase LpxI [Bryobacteraceae bacterium]|nr:UDP-2,3-diacylglucosamine diphosphatase LpxI [Bryobacteraceae bacterium]